MFGTHDVAANRRTRAATGRADRVTARTGTDWHAVAIAIRHGTIVHPAALPVVTDAPMISACHDRLL